MINHLICMGVYRNRDLRGMVTDFQKSTTELFPKSVVSYSADIKIMLHVYKQAYMYMYLFNTLICQPFNSMLVQRRRIY